MTTQLRQGVVAKKPVILAGEIEGAQVYVVAGRKGNPLVVWLKGCRGCRTWATEEPPIFGLLQRGGQVVIQMLTNVQLTTIKPIIQATVKAGSLIYTDEYDIYHHLPEWGYAHQTVQPFSR